MKDSKTIVFIPPNARFKKQDFSLIRISTYLNKVFHIKSILIYIEDDDAIEEQLNFDMVYKVRNKKELFQLLESLNYSFIFHRTWMHSYTFAAKLLKKYKNTIINIKDWNFANKDTYKFLFNNHDHDGIRFIFENAKFILSHFTEEQSKKWIKEYKLKENRFIFFPEFCNEENFVDRKNIKYKSLFLTN